MRDDKWLFGKLDEIWDGHFSDVPQRNDVKIVWGRRAKGRLGSIKEASFGDSRLTVITVNRLFQDEKIPEYVVSSVIAHELVHYTHGFHSPLEQRYETPHAGGVVGRELGKRGLGGDYEKQKRWLKNNWSDYVRRNMPASVRRRRRRIRL